MSEKSAGHRIASPETKGIAAQEISRAVVRLMHRYTGRGPTKAQTTVNTNFVVVVLAETLTRGELNLVDAGQSDAVLTMRRTYHDAMRAEGAELVAEIMHRGVISAMADIDVDQDVAVLVFLLDPQPESGIAVTADAADADPPID